MDVSLYGSGLPVESNKNKGEETMMIKRELMKGKEKMNDRAPRGQLATPAAPGDRAVNEREHFCFSFLKPPQVDGSHSEQVRSRNEIRNRFLVHWGWEAKEGLRQTQEALMRGRRSLNTNNG
ncbi:hypothetical protein TNCV_1501121 [Trichonephila clavipes]|uniref:Uncharacterized protein n=1 Tax=Trichonephila clavipes TaxID=2585209 RepID=A0A8X6VA21_TRICX|nr:hypothetical protein TNCV_1501121 [Trichonephila clavipes]